MPTFLNINLHRHTTALDVANAIHARGGHHAVAAYIDKEQTPLYTELQPGQTVRIKTSEGEKPKPEWHEFVVTSKARSSIRAHLKNLERADSEIGRAHV